MKFDEAAIRLKKKIKRESERAREGKRKKGKELEWQNEGACVLDTEILNDKDIQRHSEKQRERRETERDWARVRERAKERVRKVREKKNRETKSENLHTMYIFVYHDIINMCGTWQILVIRRSPVRFWPKPRQLKSITEFEQINPQAWVLNYYFQW